MVSDSYNIISICSGVGGLDLGVGLAVRNARTVCHVEREVQAAAVLAARMEDEAIHEAPIWSDLSTFDGKPWRGLVDCIISGDPCQPNSVAGSRLGSADDRFLIDQLIRVIEEVRPARIFRENVTGNADGQLEALIPALERLGYSVAAGIFSASEVGASHQRERLFIMADAKCSKRRPRKSTGNELNGEIAQRQKAASRIGKSGENVAHSHGGNTSKERQQHGGEQRFQSRGSKNYGDGNLANAAIGGCGAKSHDSESSGQLDKIGAHIRLFAPGPKDEAWADIIIKSPILAPSLAGLDIAETSIAQAANEVGAANQQEAAKSIFRRMADGLAPRVDRLRASGNGVCSMAGAIAWLSLASHFEQG